MKLCKLIAFSAVQNERQPRNTATVRSQNESDFSTSSGFYK